MEISVNFNVVVVNVVNEDNMLMKFGQDYVYTYMYQISFLFDLCSSKLNSAEYFVISIYALTLAN